MEEVEKKNFIVVRSSAGSGKTYTLVERFLLMLFRSNDLRYYRRILAITFTNKATNEMKNRVLDALDGIALQKSKYKKLTSDLAENLQLSKQAIIEKSDTVLRNLIHDYAQFSISTIDRFVYKIIKSFAFELHIPASAEIELNRDSIIKKSVDAFFNNISNDEKLVEILIEFAEHKFRTNKSIDIENDLIEMATEIIDSKTEPYIKELANIRLDNFSKIRSRLKKRVQEIELVMRGKAKELADILKSNGIEDEDIFGGKSTLPKYLQFFIGRKFEMKEPYSRVLKIQESGNWKGSKVSKEQALVIEGLSTSLSLKLDELLELFNELQLDYEFIQIISGRLHSMALVNEIRKEIDQYKKENEIVQLEDFNSLIAKLIDDSPVPYLYERIGDKYHHYLIDEFQDTSQIQWYNLLPLVENSFSEGFESILVGDVKQAIYRFRGGDVSQMSRLPKIQFPNRQVSDLESREKVLESTFELQNLSSNYRSSTSVVTYINSFFDKIVASFPDETESIYLDHQQNVENKEVVGSVDIRFLPPKEEDAHRLETIKEGIDQYIQIGYEYSDMAILCRKKSQCTSLANYLMQNNIPVISSESLKLSSSSEVIFLINWIKFLKESKKELFEFPILQYLSNEALLGKLDNDAMLKLWKSGKGLNYILKSIYPEINLDLLPSYSLPELCTTITQLFLKIKSTDPFVINFIDQLSKFQEQWGNDASQFLEWWEEKGINIDVEMPEKNDAIKIMTIHKSKGLEFKIVLIPYLNSIIDPGEDHFWLHTEGRDKELIALAWLPANKRVQKTAYANLYNEEMSKSFIDSLNLMYVAMTRAGHHLFILSSNQKTKDNKYREDNLLWKSFEIQDYRGSEEEGRFFTGSLDEWKGKEKETSDVEFTYFQSEGYDWKKRINLKFRVDNNVLSDDEFTAKEYGNMMHDVLSKIDFLDEVPAILKQYVSQGLLSQKNADEMCDKITNSIKGSVIELYFERNNYQIFNEREILSKEGLVYRPDRMVMSNNKIIVIDYKSGMPDISHKEQVEIYLNVLKQIEKKQIQGYLLYIGSGEIKKIA